MLTSVAREPGASGRIGALSAGGPERVAARGEGMRIDHGRLGWGVFFILVGAVPLAYHAGLIPSSAITEAWRLWPLILVGLGLGFILSRTPAAFVGGVVVAAMIGAIVGGALSAAPNVGCGHGSSTATTSRDGTFDGSATLKLNLQCGTVAVGGSSGSAWSVSAANDAGRAPAVVGGSAALTVTANDTSWWPDRGTESWRVLVPADGTVAVSSTIDFGDARLSFEGAKLASASITLDMGSVHVDLSGGSVGHISLSTNLGAAWLELDGSSDLSGNLSTNLGSLSVCAPGSLGVSVHSSGDLNSSDMSALGMTLVGGSWQTANYATAEHHANLTVSTSLGSLKLQNAGGCK
jgi:hypothetical protein